MPGKLTFGGYRTKGFRRFNLVQDETTMNRNNKAVFILIILYYSVNSVLSVYLCVSFFQVLGPQRDTR